MVDQSLVRRAIEGDPQSFGELYDSLAPELYRVALYTLGNAHDAEDAVSDTFYEAYKGIKNLRDEASVKRWMLTILSARCKRRIGGYIKERKTVDIDSLIEVAEEPASDEIISTDRLEIQQAMQEISEEERLIINLSAMHGYTTKEISEMLGMPHGTISSKLYRAYKKLRAVLT